MIPIFPVLWLLSSACSPPADEVRLSPHMVAARDVWSADIEATWPTDVMARADGGFWVVNGYKHAVQQYGSDRKPLAGAVATSAGHPIRITAARDGGAWITEPDLSRLVKLNAECRVERELVLHGSTVTDSDTVEALAVLDLGDNLVVAGRDGRIIWMDPRTGTPRRVLDKDADGFPFDTVTDLSLAPDGSIFATAPQISKVHEISPDGAARSWFGRFGPWAGYLMKPESVAPGPGLTRIVADTTLGAVQVFDSDGTPLGIVAMGKTPLRFDHAIAIDAVPDHPGQFLVLDAGAPRVWGFTLDETAIVEARGEKDARSIRHVLADKMELVAGRDGEGCLQCHDGLVNDDRQVWDPGLGHHPVNVIPGRAIPAFFPLDDQGRIVCITCHSPHGTTDPSQAATISGDEVPMLVRHEAKAKTFTRVSLENSALCVACHEDAAHTDAVAKMTPGGGGHITGTALSEALAKRPGGTDNPIAQQGCLSCHAVHGAAGNGLARDTADGRSCLACHAEKGNSARNHAMDVASGPSVHPPRETACLPMGPKGGVTCLSCHDLIGGTGQTLLRRPTDTNPLCTSCHDDPTGHLRGAHGNLAGDGANTCLACHQVHDAPASQHLVATLDAATAIDPLGCLSCHGRHGNAFQSGVIPGSAGHPVANATWDDSALTCLTCHDKHKPLPASDCAECHADQVTAKMRGGHGDTDCSDCHPTHSESPMSRVTDPQQNPRSQRCLACHSERAPGQAPKVADYQHPAPVFMPDGTRWTPLGNLPLFGPKGQELPRDGNGDLACESCHLVHGPDAGREADNLQRQGWQEPCASCHGEDALVLYLYFHRPDQWEQR